MFPVGQATTYFGHQLLIAAHLDTPAIAMALMRELADIQTAVDIVQKLFTIAAIIAGGIWTYFNFFRGRTYRMRLEPEVSGKAATFDGMSYLIAKMSLKNVGLSRVEVEQKGSALQVLSYEAPVGESADVVSAAWKNLVVFPVFESHQWIEPGELIEEQRLIVIPTMVHTAFQLQLRIVSHKISWNAMDTITFRKDELLAKEGEGNV
jgi:hypothetical protein